MTSSVRRLSAATAVALACSAAALPSAASAEEQAPRPSRSSARCSGTWSRFPRRPFPAHPSTSRSPAEPARPATSGSDPTPQAYIKKRVVLRTFRGTVRSVDAATGQIVVRTKHRSASGRVIVRRQTFGLTGARMTVVDTNGDGVVTIADIHHGDRVRLRAAVGRGPAADRSSARHARPGRQGPVSAHEAARAQAQVSGRNGGSQAPPAARATPRSTRREIPRPVRARTGRAAPLARRIRASPGRGREARAERASRPPCIHSPALAGSASGDPSRTTTTGTPSHQRTPGVTTTSGGSTGWFAPTARWSSA